jgi:heme oxygenase (mycobilin-producing)
VLSVTHYVVATDDHEFAGRAAEALAALAASDGYLAGSLGRSTDDPQRWVIVTEWRDVGSYRRALGGYEVKMRAAPLLARALDQETSFEQLVQVAPGGARQVHGSDRA